MAQAKATDTTTAPVHQIMCPPSRQRLTFEMLNEVNERLCELRHMAAFAGQISRDLVAEDEHDPHFRLLRDEGDRLAFCVLNIESRIDDLLEFVGGVFSNSSAPECA
jgi:hypothetical protein